jgi:hypothetical protein
VSAQTKSPPAQPGIYGKATGPELPVFASRSAPARLSFGHRLLRKARLLASPYRNLLFTRSEKLLCTLPFGERLRVMIGDMPEWQDEIRGGFRHSRHQIEFGAITPQSFAQYDLVVPMTVADLVQARRWPELLQDNAIPFPTEASFSLCDDKYEFNRWLINSGYGAYVPPMGAELAHPYILKKRIGVWGKQCRVIRDADEEATFQKQIIDPAYFCQEIIHGTQEFATHILFVKGRIAKSLNIMYEFESETPIKGQDRFLYRTIHRCPYLGLFSEVLGSIGFEGLCCVNYKVAHGHPYILEINPRFGGSLAPYFFSFLRGLNS